MRADMLKAYVESLLERLIGATKVEADPDGDYPVRYKNALYYVRVVGDGDPVVQIFSIAVEGVTGTPALFEELNTINVNIKFARVFWVRDQVLVERELVGEGVDPADFDNACEAVATIADHYGPLIAERFGGKTAFADEKTTDTAAPESPDEPKRGSASTCNAEPERERASIAVAYSGLLSRATSCASTQRPRSPGEVVEVVGHPSQARPDSIARLAELRFSTPVQPTAV